MKQTFLYLTLLSIIALATIGCSKSDDEYNADTAPSYYKPGVYERMVDSILITSTVDGRDYSWNYNFIYDAQNRIKEIRGLRKFYESSLKQNCEETIISKYYFFDNVTLGVEYFYNIYIPKTGQSGNRQGKYYGCFDGDGKLISFDSFDCEYEGLILNKVYTDYETSFALEYDRYNNIIKTYQLDSLGTNPIEKTILEYEYSNKKNNTNIDFASFLGYNIAERNIQWNKLHPYEYFHLGAFEMFGSRSYHLPKGEWTFDEEGYPVKYISPKERTYIIKYKQ